MKCAFFLAVTLMTALPSAVALAATAQSNLAITVTSPTSGGGGDSTIGLLPAVSDGYANWSVAGLNAIPFTASIATNGTMTVTYSPSQALGVGQVITGTGVPSGATITAAANDPSSNSLTGTGAAGTYTVSPAPSTAVSSEAMTAAGIPNRCASLNASCVSATLNPSGGNDSSALQAAINTCGPGKVISLGLGVFHLSGSAIALTGNGCTIRGSGAGQQLSTGLNAVGGGGTTRSCTSGSLVTYPGGSIGAAYSFCTDATATQIVRTDGGSYGDMIITSYAPGNNVWNNSYNLSADAVQGAYSVSLSTTPSDIHVGDIVEIDELTTSDPNVEWGYNYTGCNPNATTGVCTGNCTTCDNRGYGARRVNSSLMDLMEVSAVNGATITFDTPITYAYKTAYNAQLTTYPNPFQRGVGIENLFVLGSSNNQALGFACAYCWAKGVEVVWSYGGGIGFNGGFRNVLRDSFIHEGPSAEPGGAGYLVQVNVGTAESLLENNQMWNDNKVDAFQMAGGGNVFAYNYAQDAFGKTYPDSPEAGINAGHKNTPHLELLEGNYSHNFKGDAFWGSSITITVFRNWLTALRDSSPPNTGLAPLKTYRYSACPGTGSGLIYYGDYAGNSRMAVDVQAYSYHNAFVGNVLGYNGQTLLTPPAGGCDSGTRGAWFVQILNSTDWNTSRNVSNNPGMWQIGTCQNCGSGSSWIFVPNQIATITRTGNWDWVSAAESCYDLNAGMGGTTNQGCSGVVIPNSFYLTSKPSFFGTHPWPWVDPTTGTTSGGSGSTSVLLPAKYCFEHNQMPTCLQ